MQTTLFLELLFFQRRSDWKTTRIKAIYGTGKISG
jgi:hypothetical protein